ncbi:Halomucin [Frankliniella fusca]|uniref:Halomucin n=1 Tax=Frankliniella fusca TaxID=407009 RepID=A0AAE1GPR5_9NEOP|nr:Halomucin [Frankliniella fusca]
MSSSSSNDDDGGDDTSEVHRSTTFRRRKRAEKLKLRLLKAMTGVASNQQDVMEASVSSTIREEDSSNPSGKTCLTNVTPDTELAIDMEERDTEQRSSQSEDNNSSPGEDDSLQKKRNRDDSSEDLGSEKSTDGCSTQFFRLEHLANAGGGNLGDDDPDDDDDDDDPDDDDDDPDDDDDDPDDNDDDVDNDSENDEGNGYWAELEVANPEEGDNNAVDNGDSDPEDDDPGDTDSESEDDNNGNGGDGNLYFNPQRMNIICHLYANRSVKEVLALVLALFDRHSWTYESLIDCFLVLNLFLGGNFFPKCKQSLWNALNRNSLGMKRHAYCPRCRRSLGRYKDLPNRIQCPGARCGRVFMKRNIPYFMELSLKSQLAHFLARPDASELLFSKANRAKHNDAALEDIYDGEEYRHLEDGNEPILGEYDFTYTFNNDGFRCTTSSSVQANPIYIRLNELPLNVRQKHLFLAGIWMDKGDPEMVLFLQKCLVRQGNRLSREGITWNAPGKGVITSKFLPTCCTVDAKARCIMMNMMGPTGYYGCTFCPIEGVQANGVKFPLEEEEEGEMPQPRTDAELRALMEAAHDNPLGDHQGVKGISPLMYLQHFNLGTGMSTDDLHPFFEGVVLFHMDKLLTDNMAPYYIGAPANVAIINARLMSMKPPTLLARTPRTIDSRAKWRGHEWRNWILYYAYPCLTGLLPQRYLRHLLKLSRAIFLVSRDSVTENDLREAEEKFTEYVREFQNFFQVECMRYNVHVLLHVVRAVRCWGPAFVHSTFNFESWNRKLKKHIKSMKDPILQIVNRHLITSFISSVPFDPVNFSPDVQLQVSSILLKSDLKTAETVGDVHLLGQAEHGMVSEEERLALENFNIRNIQGLTRYKRALYGRLEIRSTEYTRSGKNNNTHILSWNGTFYRVKSIAKVRRVNYPDTCLLFVHQVELNGHANIVSHFGHVALVQNHHLEVCSFESVRVFAIHAECAGLSLIVPMPNSCEID